MSESGWICFKCIKKTNQVVTEEDCVHIEICCECHKISESIYRVKKTSMIGMTITPKQAQHTMMRNILRGK